MISTYSRGNVTLTVDQRLDVERVMFTVTRDAPLTADEVRRVNAELADYPAAHGAQLVQSSTTGEWEIRAGGTVMTSDKGHPTALLQWIAQ